MARLCFSCHVPSNHSQKQYLWPCFSMGLRENRGGGREERKKERKNERGTVQRNSTSMNPDHRTAWLGILDAGLSARILQSTVEYSLYARDGMKSRADVDGLRNAVNAPTKTDNSSIFGSGS